MIRECQLVFKSYMVDEILPGMLFLTYVHPTGWQIVKIEKAPKDSKLFLLDNGYPVQPWVIDIGNPNVPDDEILATPDQIGWMDEGDHTDELMDIEVRHMNFILDRYNGWVGIETDNDGDPVLFMDKVTISYPEDIDDEWDDIEDEYLENDDWEDEGPEHDGAGFTEDDR